jgi:MFS family permease
MTTHGFLGENASREAEAERLRTARRVLLVLFLVNANNYFDRAVPAIVIEPIALEFGLSDLQIGIFSSSFIVVFALAGLPLGRLADRVSRTQVAGWGLVGWSLLTAATGAAWNYASLLVARLGVGVGEASYSPAANSLIADHFRPAERARASGVFMLGLPVGLVLAYFTVGSIAEAFGSWRAPFFVAAVPGLLLAVFLFRIREPLRGATEHVPVAQVVVGRPLRRILSTPTIWWLVLAGIGYNFAGYATNTFTVPLMQRYFGLDLVSAAVATGVIVGVTGLIALTLGGVAADRAYRRSVRARVLLGATSVTVAAPVTAGALLLGPEQVVAYTVLFAVGWLLGYLFITAAYPAVHDVVEPRLRATAIAVLLALQFLLGGASGPIVVGALSDMLAAGAVAGGVTEEAARGVGLHGALFLVPASLLLTGLALFAAATTVTRDSARMLAGLEAEGANGGPIAS